MMPLSPKDQALFDRVWREAAVRAPTPFTEALSRLIEAVRAEERAKAEARMAELDADLTAARRKIADLEDTLNCGGYTDDD